MYSLKVS